MKTDSYTLYCIDSLEDLEEAILKPILEAIIIGSHIGSHI